MRHRKDHRKLSRTREHRKALLRNLTTSLIQHERIETTVAKAKEARRMAERMITFAKRGDVAARRHVSRFVHGDDVVRKLFDTVAPWYADRNGGYTRIIKVGRRLGDAGQTALLELVKSPELKERLRKEAEERIKAERAAEKGKKGGKVAKGAEAPAAEKGAAPAGEGEAPRKERAPKPSRGDRLGRKGGAPKSAPHGGTRARQRGKSGD
ncbi:MAG TPA: 50S ribosomal protein L17, partial [Candidatus Omnitrophota bacterium]|jgi:large subunit ribosomal protein L17|nr:50S ribosomal protein L17 [Candidatus Omnitrophota bacterium]